MKTDLSALDINKVRKEFTLMLEPGVNGLLDVTKWIICKAGYYWGIGLFTENSEGGRPAIEIDWFSDSKDNGVLLKALDYEFGRHAEHFVSKYMLADLVDNSISLAIDVHCPQAVKPTPHEYDRFFGSLHLLTQDNIKVANHTESAKAKRLAVKFLTGSSTVSLDALADAEGVLMFVKQLKPWRDYLQSLSYRGALNPELTKLYRDLNCVRNNAMELYDKRKAED